jgi:hypothetical protein
MRTRRSPSNQERLWRELGDVQKPTKRKRTRLLSRAEARARLFSQTVKERCPVCDEPALDGQITCGKVACDEAEQRVRWQHGMMTKEEINEVENQ